MTLEAKQPTIHNKLADIQQELNAPKSQYNEFGKYEYRSCEDILSALKPILNGAVILLTDEIVQVAERYYVKATATLTDGESSISTTAFAREEETKKGMDASQITGSASSYARKYALNGLFAIDDTKDSDVTNRHGKTEKVVPGETVTIYSHDEPQPPAEHRQEPPKSPNSGLITESQRRAIFAIKKALGMTDDQLKEKFNIEHTSDLTSRQASSIIDELKKMQRKV